jgi:transcriptional regulator with XRE-family HTH domain
MSGLAQWREQQRLTLEQLADLTGFSPAMLCRLERGERQASRETKVKIASRLHVRIRTLFPLDAHRVITRRRKEISHV